MSTISVETILQQIGQLPSAEQFRLRHLWNQQRVQAVPEPFERSLSPIPVPDYSAAEQWLDEHAREYTGQWVALDGNRLIAHGADARAVYAAAKADGAYLPLVELVEAPDAPPFAG